ncbi:molecular chaperone DnaJ [Iodidimonas sp. SYSU 1G8]|uniref:molecular chaperone DnaJ n=1 Tax=Iodidimonas sp. SYSU 1G8 TaxID=3133967 RepID=UPI0031FF0C68
MAKADYYELLGIARGASDAEIKKAFRSMAMECHPDRNPGDAAAEQKFRSINEAYEVLKDPQKRAAYDQYGHAAFENGGRPGAGGFDFNFNGSFSDIFEDLFGNAFGGRGGQRRGGPQRGADLRYNYEVTLEEAFAGKQAEITIKTSVACEPCDGSGAAPGSKPVTCPTCQGMGKVRAQQGFFTVERTCPTCHGAGQTVSDPCTACGGAGHVMRDKTLSVNIPVGVENGTRIRLSGEGEAGGRGGPAGDLYLFLSVRQHPLFERDGIDLHVSVPIPMTTAALGGQIEVPTIDGKKARVSIPEGTQTGRQFRLRGKGMPRLQRGGVGDMFVHVGVETPVNLTKDQVRLLKEFEAAGGGNQSSPESDGFFAKAKEFWDDLIKD